ncbi:hypothetical protein DEI92_00395 [Curtobacterium sp. MCBD17_034]|uniref:helix-turn-helix transcriptional regulator n=1 Tax=unclassified Curtobacterium TaxID=257496 RepID=UPI000DA836EE|nr:MULTISPECIES: helix-turn-helix transcriptional regulator [unclassified Curtobacterium]PZF62024.1 hypothetical protein DEI92_00395 [Curtobacterium sp. MCBD17_034]PZM34042.1 hypothetical protein DEI90_10305 [Curtobacterium sp. MCBD17_031]
MPASGEDTTGAMDTTTGAAATPIRIEAHGLDADRAMDDLPRLYAGAAWSSAPTRATPYRYRYAAMGDTDLTLRTSRMHGEIQGDIPPGGDYVVQWLTAGRSTVDLGHDDLRMVPGRPLLFPAHRSFVFRFTDYDQKLVHLGRDHVDRIAREQGLAGEDLRFDHTAAPTDAAVRSWQGTVGLVSNTMRSGPVSPLLWDELTRMTAIAFLGLYPPLADALPSAVLLPRNARIRAAVEYVQAHVHEPIGTTEIAAAAHLSVRALQEGFRRVLDTTPLGYLRQARLDRVHAELQQGVPGTTVAGVAQAWGFTHLGRFAGAYRARFGEHPRATLRG